MNCLQIPIIFWVDGKIICQLLNAGSVNDIRQIELHTAEPLLCQPSASEGEMACTMLKRYELPVLIKFRQNCSKQEAKYYIQRYINLLLLSGTKKNSQSRRTKILLYTLYNKTQQLILSRVWRYKQVAGIIIPVIGNFLAFALMTFLYLLLITSVYARCLLSKQINMPAEFEEKFVS